MSEMVRVDMSLVWRIRGGRVGPPTFVVADRICASVVRRLLSLVCLLLLLVAAPYGSLLLDLESLCVLTLDWSEIALS